MDNTGLRLLGFYVPRKGKDKWIHLPLSKRKKKQSFKKKGRGTATEAFFKSLVSHLTNVCNGHRSVWWVSQLDDFQFF